MNYELAKQLKDAGFPQQEWTKESTNFLARENGDSKEGEYCSINDRTMLLKYFGDEYLEQMSTRGLIVYIPTLSELIKACGDRFNELCHIPENISITEVSFGRVPEGCCFFWSASSFTDNKKEYIKSEYGKGYTPEEAVAKLWLKLNKK